MERSKFTFPDAVNSSSIKDFTPIPNTLLKNSEISAKAKTILFMLLSNKEGWKSHALTFEHWMKEKTQAIQNALQELEQQGYLLRLKCRDEKNKVIRGSFWSYADTPWEFNLHDTLVDIFDKGMEVYFSIPEEKARSGFSINGFTTIGFTISGKPGTNNTILNKTNLKNIKKEKNNTFSSPEEIPTKEEITLTIKERNKLFRPIAHQLSFIIQEVKNIDHTTEQINQWTNEIRMLSEGNKISPHRIKAALDWYNKNIGGEFIPVIESGSALRAKFDKLENAIIRSERKPQSDLSKSGGFRSPSIVYRKADRVV